MTEVSLPNPVALRQSHLARFEQDPTSDTLWQEAFDLALEEVDVMPNNSSGIAADIPAEELIEFAQQVRQTEPARRYDLTAEQTSNGKIWFDVLEPFSSPMLVDVQAGLLQEFLDTTGRTKFSYALDLGAGTGNSLPLLESLSQSVAAVDQNPALLSVADQASPGTRLIHSPVDSVPVADGTFDLITSMGLVGALDRRATERYYQEVARILSSDGLYLELSCYPNATGSMGPDMDRITQTNKGMLADMIVNTVSGKLTKKDSLSSEERMELLEYLGLFEEIRIVDAGNDSVAFVRQLTKTLPAT